MIVGSNGDAAEPHVDLSGESLDHVHRRAPAARLPARRPGERYTYSGRRGESPERVSGQQLGLDHEPVERPIEGALPWRPGGAVEFA